MTSPRNLQVRHRALLLVFMVLAFSSLFIAPASADAHDDNAGIICGGNENVQVIFRYMISLFMLFGFTFGVLFWAAEWFETSILGKENFEIFGGLSGEGKEAVKSGILLPVIVYFFDFIDVLLFGVEISCIVPKP